MATLTDYKPQEGPVLQVYASPNRKICDQCTWCKMTKVYKARSSEILSARCTHEEAGSDLDKKLRDKYPHFFGKGVNLDHDDLNVSTPDWCPVEASQRLKTGSR